MKFPKELNGYVFKTKMSHLDGGHRLWSGMERDRLCHVTLPKTHYMKMAITTQSIPAWSSPGTSTAHTFCCWPSGLRWKVCDWWTTIIMCQKQHHYRHLECEVTESSWKSWRANTRNVEILMEHPWTPWRTLERLLSQKATNSSLVAVKLDMSMELDSSFTKTLWMP